MGYRDWEGGDVAPGEHPPAVPWSGALPVEPHSGSGAGTHRTPSRRRAADRGQPEPSDDYLPRWAWESGAHDGGGRHRQEISAQDARESFRVDAGGAAEDDTVRPGWRASETTSSWHRVTETTSWHDAPVSDAGRSEHTRGWTLHGGHDEGYVGSRRAVEDEPADDRGSGGPGRVAPKGPSRHPPSPYPRVVWSGGVDPEPEDRSARSRPARRSRQTAEPWPAGVEPAGPQATEPRATEPWSVEPAESRWARAAWHQEARATALPDSPVVDPWDASGVHVWDDSTPNGGQPGGSASWSDGTGQWDRFTEVDRWDATGTGRWARLAELGPDRAERPWADSGDGGDGFWSGTRLAGDDPRWMGTPSSAPRSPAVSGWPTPPSTPAPAHRWRVEGTDWRTDGAGRRAAAAARRVERAGDGPGGGAVGSRRQPVSDAGGRRGRRIEEDLLDPDPVGPVRPLVYTVACYLVPAVLVVLWLVTLSGQAPPGCVTDLAGGGCDSPRAHALGSLVAGGPRFGLALVSSLVVASALWRVGTTWRAATVGLAAAVIGGGLSTVLISAVTGEPLG